MSAFSFLKNELPQGARDKNVVIIVIISIAVPFTCYILFLLTNPLYFSTDSMEVAIITNGLYGDDNYCQYIHPFLCKITRYLSFFLPNADCFTLLMHVAILVQYATFFLLLAGRSIRIQTRSMNLTDYGTIILALLSILFSSFGLHIWNVNYTIQTACITFVGLLTLFVSANQRRSVLWILIGTILTSFGFMVRQEAALLFLPFIGLEMIAIVIDLWRDNNRNKAEKQYYIRNMRCLFPALLIVVLLLTSKKIIYSVEPGKTAYRYNSARTEVVDYPMKSWSNSLLGDNEDKNTSFKKEDYIAARRWFLADTEIMTAERLEVIAQRGRKNQYNLSQTSVSSILKDMKGMFFQTNIFFQSLLIIAMILIVRNIIACSSLWTKIEAVLTFTGSFLIIAYYTFRGRAPIRVWEPVIFAAIFTLSSSALRDKRRINADSNYSPIIQQKDKKYTAQGKTIVIKNVLVKSNIDIVTILLIICILWQCIGQIVAGMCLQKPQNVLTARDSSADMLFADTLKEENSLYIWKNFESDILLKYMEVGKLPSYKVLSHNIPLGYWTYGQPYFTTFLDQIGHVNPIRDLVEKPNVFIMANDSYILDYLHLHYANEISLIESERIGSKPAFQVNYLE